MLVGVLAVLNVLDLVSTRAVLSRGGVERNPLMRPVMDDLWHGALVKGACLALIVVLLARCPAPSRRADLTMLAVCGWYLLVVGWNLQVLARVG